MFVKPTTGRAVRDPVKGTLLPVEGAEVPESTFWNRRLRDGDVEKLDPAKKAAASSKNADAASINEKPAATSDTGSAS